MTFRINDQESLEKTQQYFQKVLSEQNSTNQIQNQSLTFPQSFNITIGLLAHDSPAAVSNFIHLSQRPDRLSYINKKIHCHNYSNWFQLGDNDYDIGISGYSVFGTSFTEEDNELQPKARTVCMRSEKGRQKSQFYFIMKDQDNMDARFGNIFGYIIDGFQYLKIMDEALRNQNDNYVGMQGSTSITKIIIDQLENEYQIEF